MDPISASLQTFQKQVRAFVRDSNKAMLCIVTGAEHIPMLSKVLRGEEWQPGNRSPFIIVDSPWIDNKDEIPELIGYRVCEHYKHLVEGFKKDGVTLPTFSAAEQDDSTGPATVIAGDLQTFTRNLEKHCTPPFFCWLPSTNRKEAAWMELVLDLFEILHHHAMRMVVAVEHEKHCKPAEKVLGEAVAIVHFTVDAEATNDYFEKLFGKKAAGHAAGTPSGAAAPDVAPPPRKLQPPSEERIKEALTQLDMSPVLSASQAEALRDAIFAAAIAAGKRDEATALNEQQKACAICMEAGVKLEHALMRLTLANYHLQFEKEPEAMVQYEEAASIAGEIRAYTQLAQIRMAQAFVCMRKKKQLEMAIDHYEQAAAAAGIGASWLLYLESLRMLGTCHVKNKDEESAKLCWQAAIVRGEKMDKNELGASTFLDISAHFIKVLEKEGLAEQAESVKQIVAEIGAQFTAAGSAAA